MENNTEFQGSVDSIPSSDEPLNPALPENEGAIPLGADDDAPVDDEEADLDLDDDEEEPELDDQPRSI